MKIKKWIALLLATVMLVSLAACSDTNSGSKKRSSKDGDLVTVYLFTEGTADIETDIETDIVTLTCTYDDDWNLVKIGSPDSGEVSAYMEFDYDSDGNLIQIDDYNYGVKEYQVTFTYNESGQVVQRCEARFDNDEYVTDNVTEYVTEYEYDENGFLTWMSVDNPAYDSSTLSHFEYDEEGKLAREIREGSVVEYTYDKNGNRVLVVVSYNDGPTYQYESVYDESARLTHEYFVYDEGGRLTLESRPSERGEDPVIENIYEDDAFPVTSILRQDGFESRVDLTYTKTQMTLEQANTLQRTFEEMNSFWWPTVIIVK